MFDLLIVLVACFARGGCWLVVLLGGLGSVLVVWVGVVVGLCVGFVWVGWYCY